MGSGRDQTLVQHTRPPTGIQSTALRQYTLAHPGITSGALVPMKSGHAVVFASMRDIGWLDLDSGASDIWRTSPTFGIPFAKLDETHIMFDRTEGMRLRRTSTFRTAALRPTPVAQ